MWLQAHKEEIHTHEIKSKRGAHSKNLLVRHSSLITHAQGGTSTGCRVCARVWPPFTILSFVLILFIFNSNYTKNSIPNRILNPCIVIMRIYRGKRARGIHLKS